MNFGFDFKRKRREVIVQDILEMLPLIIFTAAYSFIKITPGMTTLLIIAVISTIYFMLKKLKQIEIVKNGVKATAIITAKNKKLHYKYEVDGKNYIGHTNTYEVLLSDVKIGDEIEIYYDFVKNHNSVTERTIFPENYNTPASKIHFILILAILLILLGIYEYYHFSKFEENGGTIYLSKWEIVYEDYGKTAVALQFIAFSFLCIIKSWILYFRNRQYKKFDEIK